MDLKLGKAQPRKDARTIRLTAVTAEAPEVPAAFDNDAGRQIPTPMFANDQYGDCVIAGRAHMTLRFEYAEQGRAIGIGDLDVVREYERESGGEDSGLVMLDSLKRWRHGWRAGGRVYGIHSFLSLDARDDGEAKEAVCLLSGAYVGMALPESAQAEFEGGCGWTDTSGDPGSWGGHCVYIPAYDESGPVCVTWGRRQPMSWAFFLRYCDEAYAVCDDRDRWLRNSPVDVAKLDSLLAEVEAA